MPQKSAAEALSPQNTDHPSCLFVNQLPVLNAHAILKGDFCKKKYGVVNFSINKYVDDYMFYFKNILFIINKNLLLGTDMTS